MSKSFNDHERLDFMGERGTMSKPLAMLVSNGHVWQQARLLAQKMSPKEQ
jgi:hypothetical protein